MAGRHGSVPNRNHAIPQNVTMSTMKHDEYDEQHSRILNQGDHAIADRAQRPE